MLNSSQQLNHWPNSLALHICQVYHSHSNSPYTCLFFVVPNKCKHIHGLLDIMWLNLIGFNYRLSKPWDGDDTSFVFDRCEEKIGTILHKDTLVNGERFKSILSGIGRFPVDPVNIQLTDDAVPVQKPAHRVWVSLKEKFKKEIRSKEEQGIVSRLDCNTATEWLNSFVIVKKPNWWP